MKNKIEEILQGVQQALTGYGEESYSFTFGEMEWIAKIEYDSDPLNPFTDWDHPKGFGIDMSNHRDYRGGEYGEEASVDVPAFLEWINDDRPDLAEYLNSYKCPHCDIEWEEYGGKNTIDTCSECLEEFRPVTEELNQDETQEFKEFEDEFYWLPVYMYDHSGRTVNTTGFSCGWDSGCAGITFIPKDTLTKEGVFGANESMSENQLNECAEKFLKNQVELLDQYMQGEIYGYSVQNEEETVEDSCWGFWGDTGRNDAISQAVANLKWMLEERTKELQEEAESIALYEATEQKLLKAGPEVTVSLHSEGEPGEQVCLLIAGELRDVFPTYEKALSAANSILMNLYMETKD